MSKWNQWTPHTLRTVVSNRDWAEIKRRQNIFLCTSNPIRWDTCPSRRGLVRSHSELNYMDLNNAACYPAVSPGGLSSRITRISYYFVCMYVCIHVRTCLHLARPKSINAPHSFSAPKSTLLWKSDNPSSILLCIFSLQPLLDPTLMDGDPQPPKQSVPVIRRS